MVNEAVSGAGVASMQGKWEEMFGVKEKVVEEVKVKKSRMESIRKKNINIKVASSGTKAPVEKTRATKKGKKTTDTRKKIAK